MEEGGVECWTQTACSSSCPGPVGTGCLCPQGTSGSAQSHFHEGRAATGMQQIEPRDASQQLTVHSLASQQGLLPKCA